MKQCTTCSEITDNFQQGRNVCRTCRASQRDMKKYREYKRSSHCKTLKRKAMETYRAKKRDYYCALASEHRAKRKQRTVEWSDQQYIKDLYINAREASKIFNVAFEIDHIVPLQNSKVSGLHNEFNLQVLTQSENRAKYNKFEEAI